MIAAEDNGIGGVGVAYGATLVSAYTPLSGAADEFAGLAYSQGFDIANNSWGWNVSLFNAFPDNFLNTSRSPGADASFAQYGAMIEDVAETGRDGLGTVFVFAAGNGRESGDNVNLFNFQNSRYTIAVGATDENGQIAEFSNPGAALLLSAPGVNILTTDRTGAYGYASGDDTFIYTNEFGGLFKDNDAGRRILSDGGGEDTINVAAIDLTGSENTTIDLTPGSVSMIAGKVLTIASGTTIENVIAGDDTLTGLPIPSGFGRDPCTITSRGAEGEIRTPGLLITNQLLYP